MPQTMSVKALREKRAPLAKAIRQLADASQGREFTAEEQEQWKSVNDQYNALTRDIEFAERAEAVEGEQRAAVGDPLVGRGSLPQPARNDGAVATDEHRSLALAAWFRAQLWEDPTEAQAEACRIVGLNPHRPMLAMPLLDTVRYRALQGAFQNHHPNIAKNQVTNFNATMTIGSGPSGGYLQPPESLVRQLEINMLAFGGMRQVAEPIRTTGGERMSWPTADDTSNTGAQLGESTSIGSSVDPSFGKVYWDAYKFSSKPILVPYELLQDSFVNLPVVLGEMLGERLGRITNTKFTTGTGAATCKGLVTCATSFSAASATAIAADDLLGLVHSIDPAYRMGAGFMMHDSILLALRKLKDGAGAYMFQSGLAAGQPDRLLGYSIANNQDMDSTIASGKKTILFGRLSNYKIRSVGEVRMYRLQERNRDTDQDCFIAFLREDGNLLTAGTAPVKYLSH